METKEFQLQEVLDIKWGNTKLTKASYLDSGYVAYSASGPDGFVADFEYDTEGIVISAIGASTGVTYFATGKWTCIKNTMRVLAKRPDLVDLRYFYYLTKAPNFWPKRGSAQEFLGQTELREMYVGFPEIQVQKEIAEFLFPIEEKMRNNQRQNELLQESLRSLIPRAILGDFLDAKSKNDN